MLSAAKPVTAASAGGRLKQLVDPTIGLGVESVAFAIAKPSFEVREHCRRRPSRRARPPQVIESVTNRSGAT